MVCVAARASGQEGAPAVLSPRVNRIVFEGVSVYARPRLLRVLRLREGRRLLYGPHYLASALEVRYHDDGYVAVRVSGAFSAADGTLSFAVDEGRLGEVEFADPGSLGGDFSYRRLLAHLRSRHELVGRQRVDTRVLLGLTGGTLPRQKGLALGGIGTLRGYPFKILRGENLFLATVECSLQLEDRIPRLFVFADGGTVWTARASGPGFKTSAGAGLRWPGRGPLFVRVEVAWPLGDAMVTETQTHLRLQIPF